MNNTDNSLHDNPDAIPGPDDEVLDSMFLEDWEPEAEGQSEGQGMLVQPDFGSGDTSKAIYNYPITRDIERSFVVSRMQKAQELQAECQQLVTETAIAVCQDAGIPFTPGEDEAVFSIDEHTTQISLTVTRGALKPK